MSDRTCSVDGCDKASHRCGLCSAHYHRLLRHGDPLGGGIPRIVGNDALRFASKYTQRGDDDCWPWHRPRQNGYGYFRVGDRERPAHRVSYEMVNGPIPGGLVLDHLCRNPACVNPNHLEPVTQQVNVQRGLTSEVMKAIHAARTHCKHGHEFTPENTYNHPRGYRSCRTCQRERDRLARQRGQTNVRSN